MCSYVLVISCSALKCFVLVFNVLLCVFVWFPLFLLFHHLCVVCCQSCLVDCLLSVWYLVSSVCIYVILSSPSDLVWCFCLSLCVSFPPFCYYSGCLFIWVFLNLIYFTIHLQLTSTCLLFCSSLFVSTCLNTWKRDKFKEGANLKIQILTFHCNVLWFYMLCYKYVGWLPSTGWQPGIAISFSYCSNLVFREVGL